MATIKINKKELKEHGLPYSGYEGVEVINDTLSNHSRWSVGHDLIFKWTDGKFYETYYSEGATESQDEEPWEFDDEVPCVEVQQVEKTIKVWEQVH